MKRSLPIVLSVACLLAGCGKKVPPKIDAEKEARIEREQKQARLDELIRKGKAQMGDDQFESAVVTFTEARKLDPDHTDAPELLQKAQRGLHRKRLEKGKEALAAKNYDDAIRSLNQALELAQTLAIEDEIIRKLLRDANEGREARIAAEYKRALDAGLAALSKEDYQVAFNSFNAALRLKPGDKAALDGRQSAQNHLDKIAAEAKRKQDFERAMILAREAMKATKHAEAVKHYDEALKLFPTDSNAVEGRKVALKKRYEDYELAMDAGEAALEKENYQGALNSFNEALGLIPDDAKAKVWARKAQDALDKIAGETKKKKDFDRLMVQARQAMKDTKHAEAVKLFEEAKKLNPDDADVLLGLAVATKFRQVDYQLAMLAGRNALKNQNYEDARNAYKEALRLIPEDKGAKVGLQTAQDALDAIAATAKKKKDFDGLMLLARENLTAKKYAAAVKLYEEALKLFPTDTVAIKERDLATKGAKEAALVEAEMLKREKEYAAAMNAGKAALAAKKYDEAKKAYTAALAIKPGDKDALAGLNAIAGETKKKQDFDRLMGLASAAAAAKKHAEAIKLYKDALNLFPNDTDAKNGLAAATRADAAGLKQRQEDYKLAMDAARAAAKKQDYQGAINAFKEAVRLMPTDAVALDGLHAAYTAEGRKAAQAKKFPDAVKAYSEALKLKPNDPEVSAALKRAQAGKP